MNLGRTVKEAATMHPLLHYMCHQRGEAGDALWTRGRRRTCANLQASSYKGSSLIAIARLLTPDIQFLLYKRSWGRCSRLHAHGGGEHADPDVSCMFKMHVQNAPTPTTLSFKRATQDKQHPVICSKRSPGIVRT